MGETSKIDKASNVKQPKPCYCCQPKQSDTTIISETTVDNTSPAFNAVIKIWQKKMEESQFFLPSEINHIPFVWAKFITNRITSGPELNAEEFYIETAEYAAQKLKCFADDGWECLNIEYPFDYNCSDHSLQRFDEVDADLLVPKDADKISKSVSAESISEILIQVEFLLQLVASSNFGLQLVKTALSPVFLPTFIKLKSPQMIQMPKKYVEEELDQVPPKELRKGLLNGDYDEYILPLQNANEMDDDFWMEIENANATEGLTE